MILHHGSRERHAGFSSARIGLGFEANSSLGLWLTRCPHVAAEIASGGFLHVVEVASPRLCIARDRHTVIWGGRDLCPVDAEIGGPRFARARIELMAEGFDGAWCEMPGTDLEGAVCLFRPETARVIEILDLAEGADLARLEDPPDDARVDVSRDIDSLLERLALADDIPRASGCPEDLPRPAFD